jgi:hypothetical protein
MVSLGVHHRFSRPVARSNKSRNVCSAKILSSFVSCALCVAFVIESHIQPVHSQTDDLKSKMEAHGVVKDVIPEVPSTVLEVSVCPITLIHYPDNC